MDRIPSCGGIIPVSSFYKQTACWGLMAALNESSSDLVSRLYQTVSHENPGVW